MINWEELKHIHVIRKLEEILGQWFKVDIFFLDETGTVKNYDVLDRRKEWRNPISAALMQSDLGKGVLFDKFKKATEEAYHKNAQFRVEGPIGVERLVVSRIVSDQEFLGTVCAYCVVEKDISEDAKAKALAYLKEKGFETSRFEAAFSHVHAIIPGQTRYFEELVDLVAQEIVTFHREISKRDERINALSTQLGERYSYDQMIGKSKAMQQLYGLLDKIKASESTVLVQGENGTGKELIARSIHFNSPRKTAQFVTVNCSAFNENLLDSELFGHVKGAFTGAIKDKKGLFEVADKGTLFLDEIGDMSPTMQVKLLRVLQEGTLTPVGGTEQRKVDVRVVAATNRDLKDMIEKGQFREDLYYRINVINIQVPPLRDRKEDIPLLMDFFLDRGCKEKGVERKYFIKRALEKVYDYAWPGNIRELENEVERCIVLAGDDPKVSVEVLSPRIRDWGENAKMQGVRVAGKLKDALEQLEITMIREGLKRTGFNKSRLAKELGISRAGLIMKVDKYGLDKRKLLRKDGSAA